MLLSAALKIPQSSYGSGTKTSKREEEEVQERQYQELEFRMSQLVYYKNKKTKQKKSHIVSA